jgi:hypothetical protein
MRQPTLWPIQDAAIDLDFEHQQYFWLGSKRSTSEFTTFDTSTFTFNNFGIVPSSTCSITLTTAGIWTSPGSYAAKLKTTAIPGAARSPFGIDDGTTGNHVRVEQSTGARLPLVVVVGASTQATVTPLPIPTNTIAGIAGSFNTNAFYAATNGGSGTDDTSGTLPTVTTLRIGKGVGANTEFLGIISRIVIFDSVQASSAAVLALSLQAKGW